MKTGKGYKYREGINRLRKSEREGETEINREREPAGEIDGGRASENVQQRKSERGRLKA